MEIIKKGKKVNINFTGTADLINYIDSKTIGGRHSQESMRPDFCPYSWDDTKKGFLTGWEESEKIKINADKMNMEGVSTGYSTEYAVTGDFIDVGTYLSGVPECWGSVIEEPKAMKRASILIDGMGSCMIDAKDIENRGAAIISMIDQLRDSGHYLEITISSNHSKVRAGVSVEPSITFETNNGYSRDVLAFCVAHPGMLRRMFFGVIETYFDSSRVGTYGACDTANPKGYDIFIPSVESGKWDTIEKAKSNINATIKNYERRN